MTTERLILRFDPADLTRGEWLVLDAHGNRIGLPQSGALAEAAPLAPRRRVLVLVPGEAVVMHEVTIPVHDVRRLMQALPYALEDRLADDVERLHFAIAPRTRGAETVHAAVVAHDAMRAWLDALAAAGITPDALLPEYLALPWSPDTPSLAIESGRVHVRLGPSRGFTAPLATAMALLMAVEGARVSLIVTESERHIADRLASELRARNLECVFDLMDGPLLVRLASNLHRETSLNLLQGTYRRKDQAHSGWNKWRPSIVLASVLLVLLTADAVIDQIRLVREEKRLQAEIETLFRTALPDVERIVNPRLQLEQRLAQARAANGSDGFLTLLAEAGEALAAQPDIELAALAYRGNALEISVLAGDVQAIDRLKRQIEERTGLIVALQSASNRGERIEGRLQITRSGNPS